MGCAACLFALLTAKRNGLSEKIVTLWQLSVSSKADMAREDTVQKWLEHVHVAV